MIMAIYADILGQGENFIDTKKRLEKRTGLKGKSFEKIKFAIVRRASYSKPQYLEDGKRATEPAILCCRHANVCDADDELLGVALSDEDYLGLDHVDRTKSVRNGGGDLFLR